MVVYSDCSGLKGFDKKDLPRISNHRMADLKVKMSEYWYEIRYMRGEKLDRR